MKAYFILILIIFSSALTAQNANNLEILVGRTYHNYISFDQNTSFEVFKNWKTGTSVSLAYTRSISNLTEIVARVGCHYFPYSGNDERFYVEWPLDYKVAVKNSYVYETSTGVRLGALSELGPFLTLQTGLYFFDIGKIKVSSWYMGSPDVEVYKVRETGKFDVKMFVAAGFGFNIPVSSRINFRLEATLSQTLSGDRDLNPVTASMQYRF